MTDTTLPRSDSDRTLQPSTAMTAVEPSKRSSATHPSTGASERIVRIYAGKLFDPQTLQLLPQRVVAVEPETGLVLAVEPYSDEEVRGVDFSAGNEDVVDLRAATVLPGFVDVHVHSESRAAI